MFKEPSSAHKNDYLYRQQHPATFAIIVHIFTRFDQRQQSTITGRRACTSATRVRSDAEDG